MVVVTPSLLIMLLSGTRYVVRERNHRERFAADPEWWLEYTLVARFHVHPACAKVQERWIATRYVTPSPPIFWRSVEPRICSLWNASWAGFLSCNNSNQDRHVAVYPVIDLPLGGKVPLLLQVSACLSDARYNVYLGLRVVVARPPEGTCIDNKKRACCSV